MLLATDQASSSASSCCYFHVGLTLSFDATVDGSCFLSAFPPRARLAPVALGLWTHFVLAIYISQLYCNGG